MSDERHTTDAGRLQAKILLTAVLAMLGVGIAVALAGILPLRHRLTEAEWERQVFAAHIRRNAAAEFLSRAQRVAGQISSRTRARQLLAAHEGGEIDHAELTRSLEPILLDALGDATEVLGIARFDAGGRQVVAVGTAIDPAQHLNPAIGTTMRGPLRVAGHDALLIESAIIDRAGRRLGADLVLYDLAPLRSAAADPIGLGLGGDALIVALRDGRPLVVFASRDGALGPDRPVPEVLADIVRRVVTGAEGAEAEGVELVSQPRPLLVSFARLPDLPWAVLVLRDPDAVLGPIRHQQWLIAGLIAALLVAGVAVMWFALRPLAGRIVLRVGDLEKRVAGQTLELREANDALERRVKARTAALEQANRQLATFVYSASHNLRTPLRSIISFADIVLDDAGAALDDDSRELLHRVERSAERMDEVLAALLQLSELSALEPRSLTVDLVPLATGRFDTLRARDPDRAVELRTPPTLRVEGDPEHLRVLVDALVDNAWKFTAPLPVGHVELGVVPGSAPPEYFVRDNGVGFDARFGEKLFQPFHRLHGPAEFEGEGLGLALVARVAQMHGGTARAVSEPGGGATFYFTLPGAEATSRGDAAA